MGRFVTSNVFARAVCDVLNIDHKAHPVVGVSIEGEHGNIEEIVVRFAVQHGLLNKVDESIKQALQNK